MYRVIGIDEAGKGPVLGSMFIGFSIINLKEKKDLDSYHKTLKDLGVKDSKLLTPKKRAEIYEKLKDQMDIKYVQLTPAIIDHNNAMGGKLNQLEVDSIVHILESTKPDLIIVDALTADPKKFGQEILRNLSFKAQIISENKADTKYELVGAASIVAKELREEEMRQTREKLNIDCGSGYPADPKTKKFLLENFEKKEYEFLFRKSWATFKNLIKKETIKKLDEFF